MSSIHNLTIRSFVPADTAGIIQLFKDTVLSVASRHYSPEQTAAWVSNTNYEHWQKKLERSITFVAEIDSLIVGFADITHEGYLDHMYVHKDYQACGIAYALNKRIEKTAKELNFTTIMTEASTMAMPIAQRMGYTIVEKQTIVRHDVELTRYVMKKNFKNCSQYCQCNDYCTKRTTMLLSETKQAHDNEQSPTILKTSQIATPLGSMIAIADEHMLYLLEFTDCRSLEWEIERLQRQTRATIIPGTSHCIQSIERELADYFNGNIQTFTIPFLLLGTNFQNSVWNALTQIPYGQTRSYADQAHSIGKPSASRAVANAHGANQLAIIIPCHRIIASNGKLGGYSAGIERKEWLINHEKQIEKL